ncbi:MAG: MHYT domain-containing protein [Bryobacteraceae bacterium]
MIPEIVLNASYDYRLVALSVLVAIFASYAALDLGGRVTASHGRSRFLWLTAGAAAMGTGIWAMHYIGMLAFDLPIPVFYHWPTVLLSLLAAMAAAMIALFIVSRDKVGRAAIGVGALLMGAGIATMHYVGMDAMRLQAMCHYSAGIVSLSVVLAMVISLVAIWLTFRLRSDTKPKGALKLASALVMGAAIPVMHYTGMAAVTFTPIAFSPDLTHSVQISLLGTAGIGIASLMILSLTILTSFVDRRFSAQSVELQVSEQRFRRLVESAQVILWRGDVDSTEFSYINREAEDLLGYPIENWTNTPGFWMDHIDPEDRALVKSACAAATDHGGAQQFEHRIIAGDGRAVWLKTSVQMIEGEGKNQLVGVMTDITERKRAQEEAEDTSRVNSGFLAEINRLNERLKGENVRMGAELDVTQRLQQMMLPRREDLSRITRLDISGEMEPAAEVGGDYYDVVRIAESVFFSIGDVTGHGLESGVIAIMVQSAVRTLLAAGQYESRKFFEVLNHVVYDNVRRMNCDRSLTLSLLHYREGVVTISGQHEEVLVARENGTIERHDTLDLGFTIGLEKDISRFIGEARVPLQTGDVMVVYTDGITEAFDAGGKAYGIERLSEVLRSTQKQSADGIRRAVLRSVREFIGNQELFDDMTLLVIKELHVS